MADEQRPWERLAAAVVARRNERGWTQMEVANRGGLSLDRLQAIEGVRATSYRPKTMQALERGLEWTPGSAARVLAGDKPEEVERRRAESRSPLLELLERMTNDTYSIPLLESAMNRMFKLGLSEDDLVAQTMSGIDRRLTMFGRPTKDALCRSFERVLQWDPGTIKNFMLAASDERYDTDAQPDSGKRLLLAFEEDPPVAPGEVLHNEAMTIARSGLSKETQEDLLQHVARRRREFNAVVSDELHGVIELITRATFGSGSHETIAVHGIHPDFAQPAGRASHIPHKTMTQQDVVELLERHGWKVGHSAGGTTRLTKEGHAPITLPVPFSGHYAPQLLQAVLTQAGLQQDDLGVGGTRG